jgi:glycosyltransferase involved in cell wall biosynthesis
MQLLVSTEGRFLRTPDGHIWSQASLGHSFWTRYLAAFEHVIVLARIQNIDSPQSCWLQVDGENVSFMAVPNFRGPWQYLLNATRVKRATLNAIRSQDAIILRVGSPIAATIESTLYKIGRPYGLEVVGDPYDVFAPGSIKHPFRPFFRRFFSDQLKRQCSRAPAVTYVTQAYLQRRYPPNRNAFSTHYSSVELPAEAFALQPWHTNPQRDAFATHPSEVELFSGGLSKAITLISVGSLEQLYKSPDVVIRATEVCVKRGLDIRLKWVGDGKYRSYLENLVGRLGLRDRVHFLGQLPAGKAVIRQLDQATLFVLVSRTEGLPRAMIEAMARGVPCIGSTAGGIPELLPSEDMVPPSDAVALANKICEVLKDPQRMRRMSARNLEKALEYHEDILRKRRIEFYQYVRQKTEEWLAGNTET